MLNARPRGQFPRWRLSRKRLSLCHAVYAFVVFTDWEVNSVVNVKSEFGSFADVEISYY